MYEYDMTLYQKSDHSQADPVSHNQDMRDYHEYLKKQVWN